MLFPVVQHSSGNVLRYNIYIYIDLFLWIHGLSTTKDEEFSLLCAKIWGSEYCLQDETMKHFLLRRILRWPDFVYSRCDGKLVAQGNTLRLKTQRAKGTYMVLFIPVKPIYSRPCICIGAPCHSIYIQRWARGPSCILILTKIEQRPPRVLGLLIFVPVPTNMSTETPQMMMLSMIMIHNA